MKAIITYCVSLVCLLSSLPAMGFKDPESENAVKIGQFWYSILSEEEGTATFEGLDEWDLSLSEALYSTLDVPSSVTFPSNPDKEYTIVRIATEACGFSIPGIPDMYTTNYGNQGSWWLTPFASVNIPETVTSIGAGAFYTSNIETFIFPDSVTEIEADCLAWSLSLKKIVLPTGIKEIPVGLAAWCRSLPEFEIPESVEKIGRMAFFRCNSLTKVYIPAGVKEIGDDAYTALINLEKFEVDPANEAYCAPDGILLDKEMKTLIAWPFARKDVKVPEGVERIAGEALNWGFELTSLDLPESLTDMSNTTFRLDNNLKKVTVRSLTPPECEEEQPQYPTTMFAEEVLAEAELWVPDESYEEYKAHPVWGKFAHIRTAAGVSAVADDDAAPTYYSLDGQKVDTPKPGSILIRRSGSTAEKIRY